MNSPGDLINVDKEIAGGVPVFKGTRAAIKTLFDYLEEGRLKSFTRGSFRCQKQVEEVIDYR